MKQLYVVRHAKSSWDYPELSDFDRPLNGRGKKNVPDMGERLYQRGALPDLIISSPANRAITTAKGIADKMNYPPHQIEEIPDIYHASINILLQTIQKTSNSYHSLMIFGHNPGLTWLINELSSGDYLDNLPTCGVYGLSFDINSWTEVKPGSGTKMFYDYPKRG